VLKTLLVPDPGQCVGGGASALGCPVEIVAALPLPTKAVKLGKLPDLVHAANAADDVASASNKIYSSRALQRMADEPGSFHNFPGSFDETIFAQGNRTVVPNYFNKTNPNLGNDSIQYGLPGFLNGHAGTYEIFRRPSLSGRTEMIMHRFFGPDY
jgi:hypothetical protein